MAEEFEGGVCGGNWGAWNSSRNLFASSPCSLATNDIAGSCFGWPNHDVMLTARSSDDSAGSASDGVIQDVQKPNGLQMIGITTHDNWNQDLLNDSGRSQENYSNFLNMNYEQQSSKVDNNFSDQINSSPCFPSSTTTTTTGFPLNSPSYNYTSSTLLQTLFDTQLDQEDSQPQQSFLDNYLPNSNGFLPPKPSPMLTQQPSLWNVPAAAAAAAPSTFTQSHHFHLPPSLNNKSGPNPPPTFGAKHQQAAKESVAKKGSNEAAAAFKRPRIETPSPLPTFKVRKEKLGDRITALQQLVSPFGKTDTASVLHEAIEYIKFLHDQVNALSTPYLKYGSPLLQRQQVGDKSMDGEGLIKDLNSRGLCLVPLSSTFPVATETPSDFWTPTFGGNLK